MYCELSDIILRYRESDIIDLTNEEDGADTVDENVLEACIADADALINSALLSKYSIPLDPAPAIIKRISVDITYYYLMRRRGLAEGETIQTIYREAKSILEDISIGKTTIDATASASGSRVLFYSDPKQYGHTVTSVLDSE